jgi:signal transduction histidine kinase
MTWWSSGRRTPAWWLALLVAVGLLVADVAGQASNGALSATTVTFELAVVCEAAVGLWIWAWRPATQLGPIALSSAVLYLPADLMFAFPTSRAIVTVGWATFNFGGIVASQFALAYPRRRIDNRAAFWFLLLAGYIAQVVQNAGNLLWSAFFRSYLYTGPPPWFSIDAWNRAWTIEIIVAMPILIAFLLNRLRHASRGARRTMGPLMLVGSATGVAYIVYLLSILYHKQNWNTLESYVLNVGQIAGALAALLGLLATRRARGVVGDLVVELGKGGAVSVRNALSRAIGDPTLELLLWLPHRNVWADESGAEMHLPQNADRAVTLVGEQLAAIVHDPVFLDQPALIEAAGSAVRFALENERLQVQLRAQLAELRDSRARLVRSADEERRRLERDLHDGAQQRLLGLGMALQLLHARVEGDAGAEALVSETETELRHALFELRELARGIHPAVLTDQGLCTAVRTLADRAPLPVEIQDSAEGLPPHVETAAYFIVAEALTNVAKYAHATKAWVTLSHLAGGQLLIEVRDNGVGGADPAGGSGLHGLADRVGALDGCLALDSPLGQGTRLRAKIPCAS